MQFYILILPVRSINSNKKTNFLFRSADSVVLK